MLGRLLYSATLGDMEALYWLSEDGVVSWQLNPAGWEAKRRGKRLDPESLIQVRLRGDDFGPGFGNGHTLRNGGSIARFRYAWQEVAEDGKVTRVVTALASEDGLRLRHVLTWHAGERGVAVRTEFENAGAAPVTLEMLSSFNLTGLSPYQAGDAPGSLVLHRLRSRWSDEGRLVSEAVEDLQLEPAWSIHGLSCERFGQVGSMPVRRWFPFAAVEDAVSGAQWGVQLEAPASWQIEVFRRDDGLCLSGGLADFDFGHWAKTVAPGETFVTPAAHLTACAGDLDGLCDRLTDMQRRPLSSLPRPERLPVVFNEYCATWGEPSAKRVTAMLKALEGRDVDAFVIDAGWYAQTGRSWEMNMGDWQVNGSLFPEGLAAAARDIRAAGMVPGLWFEPEICGREADAFRETEHQLKRFGTPITAGCRRFWDMRDPWVRGYLSERVVGRLAGDGFGYVKLDYNENAGAGCDGAESLGEGLRQSVAGTQDFLREIHREIPGIQVELCASGGHRLEPSFLGLCQLASATDAHESKNLPIVAANLHRVMLPEQSLIWAALRPDDAPRRLVWSLAATFLGVMCLSGDVEALSAEQWDIVSRGIAFYRRAGEIIRNGVTRRLGPEIKSYRHPTGWQAVERAARDGGERMIVVHAFEETHISLPVPEDAVIEEVFAEDASGIRMTDGRLTAEMPADSAFAVLFTPAGAPLAPVP